MMKYILAISVMLAACGVNGPKGPEVLPNLTIPPAPANGVQVITPILRGLAPSTDKEMCTWTDVITDHDVNVKSTVGYQTEPGGHHIIVYYSMVHQPPGTTRECTDADMVNFRFLAGATSNGQPNEAPGDLVFHVPAGAQLVVNHHYLNATDGAIDGQSVVNVNYSDPGVVTTPVGNLAFVDTSIKVPPGTSSWDFHCALAHPAKIWELLPHMHQWGQHITIDITHAGQQMRMVDTSWDPSFQFEPPETKYDPSTPLALDAGDDVAVHCDWNNSSGQKLTFGLEMCVAFANTVDDAGQGSWECDQSQWGPF